MTEATTQFGAGADSSAQAPREQRSPLALATVRALEGVAIVGGCVGGIVAIDHAAADVYLSVMAAGGLAPLHASKQEFSRWRQQRRSG